MDSSAETFPQSENNSLVDNYIDRLDEYEKRHLSEARKRFNQECREENEFSHNRWNRIWKTFTKEGSEEEKKIVDYINKELQKIKQEILDPYEGAMRKQLKQTPCLTHITNSSNLIEILKTGLKPVSAVGGGNYDQFDKLYPELGLRDVVHCGWGGLDRFSSQGADFFVTLILDNNIVKPEYKVTNRDWSVFGPSAIAIQGGGERGKRAAVDEYIRNLATASDYDLDPYHRVTNAYNFIIKGGGVTSGILDYPTVLIPEVSPDAIKGVIFGDALAESKPELVQQVASMAKVKTWNELKKADLPDFDTEGWEFTRLSHFSRYAESIFDGNERQFEGIFVNNGISKMGEFLKARDRYKLLDGLLIEMVQERWVSSQGDDL